MQMCAVLCPTFFNHQWGRTVLQCAYTLWGYHVVPSLVLLVQFNGTAPVPNEARLSLSIRIDEEVPGCPATAEIVRVQRVNETSELLEVLIRTDSCYVGEIVLDYVVACSQAFSSITKVQSAAEMRGITPAITAS